MKLEKNIVIVLGIIVKHGKIGIIVKALLYMGIIIPMYVCM